ncbi:MAG: preprotein translocase subunit YajC [Bacteroidota bacterium]
MNALYLQAAGGALANLMPVFLMLLVVVFFIVLPQRRKSKEQKAFMDAMAKGQKVVTASGILGTIDKIEDSIVTLNLGNKTYLRITKNAISKELTDAVYPKAADDK